MYNTILKFQFSANFSNSSAFTLFWLGIRYELVNSMDLGFKMNWSIVWVIMGRRGVSSERRRSILVGLVFNFVTRFPWQPNKMVAKCKKKIACILLKIEHQLRFQWCFWQFWKPYTMQWLGYFWVSLIIFFMFKKKNEWNSPLFSHYAYIYFYIFLEN